MWFIFLRSPRPDAPQWAGRHALAAVDAVVWPVVWVVVAMHLPARGGLIGAFVIALACLAAVSRLWRALSENRRYYFTTWRWGKPVLWLLALGLAMKLALMVA